MKYVDLPDPVASGEDVVMDVTAIGINYADTHQTEDSYLSKQTLPLIPGMEVVGKLPNGQRVLALAAGGGYCQKTLVNPKQVIPLPDQVSDGAALAMMVQGITAYHILKTVGHFKAGESVVVHAGAGGVGSLAIQLAKLDVSHTAIGASWCLSTLAASIRFKRYSASACVAATRALESAAHASA